MLIFWSFFNLTKKTASIPKSQTRSKSIFNLPRQLMQLWPGHRNVEIIQGSELQTTAYTLNTSAIHHHRRHWFRHRHEFFKDFLVRCRRLRIILPSINFRGFCRAVAKRVPWFPSNFDKGFFLITGVRKRV